jgi:hypothetical protein
MRAQFVNALVTALTVVAGILLLNGDEIEHPSIAAWTVVGEDVCACLAGRHGATIAEIVVRDIGAGRETVDARQATALAVEATCVAHCTRRRPIIHRSDDHVHWVTPVALWVGRDVMGRGNAVAVLREPGQLIHAKAAPGEVRGNYTRFFYTSTLHWWWW